MYITKKKKKKKLVLLKWHLSYSSWINKDASMFTKVLSSDFTEWHLVWPNNTRKLSSSTERCQCNFFSLNIMMPAIPILPCNKEQCHMIQKHTESLAGQKSFRIYKRVLFKNLTWNINTYDPVSQSHNHKPKNAICLVLDLLSLYISWNMHGSSCTVMVDY